MASPSSAVPRGLARSAASSSPLKNAPMTSLGRKLCGHGGGQARSAAGRRTRAVRETSTAGTPQPSLPASGRAWASMAGASTTAVVAAAAHLSIRVEVEVGVGGVEDRQHLGRLTGGVVGDVQLVCMGWEGGAGGVSKEASALDLATRRETGHATSAGLKLASSTRRR
jgi:hypothetical protein